MREDEFFIGRKGVTGKVNNRVLVGFCHISKTLLKQKFQISLVFDGEFLLFSFIDVSNIPAESNKIEVRQKLSDFLP